ncbi:MAG: hypothetical protein MZV70_57855 [Desulfobacterales bacterium]|nr:hypothetical protein [Desulfobacterales bacterium]
MLDTAARVHIGWVGVVIAAATLGLGAAYFDPAAAGGHHLADHDLRGPGLHPDRSRPGPAGDRAFELLDHRQPADGAFDPGHAGAAAGGHLSALPGAVLRPDAAGPEGSGPGLRHGGSDLGRREDRNRRRQHRRRFLPACSRAK